MAPETWGGFRLIVAFSKKARSEEIVGHDAGLGKAITALANFEVDPTVAVSTCKPVFLYEFCWDVGDLDADMFRVWHWRVKVEFFKVNCAEARSFAREHTVEHQLKSSRDAVLVQMPPGKQMRLPPMVMLV